MRFSIIVPVYNAAGFLPATVDTVSAQSFADWELLLIDDGSTDGETGALCDRIAQLDDRIKAYHKPNGGAGDARNYGISRASGDYIVFLDSDDFLEPQALEILDHALSASGADVCCFGFTILRGKDETVVRPAEHAFFEMFALSDSPAALLGPPAAWYAVWKRSLFERTQIRFRDRGWGEDLAMTRKMLTQAESIVQIPDALYRYLIREGSVTTRRNLDTNAEIIDALGDVIAWFREQGLFEQYREELCCLTLDNVYDACVRIVKADPTHPLPDRLMAFARTEFPDYRDTKYVRAWPEKRRLILSLLEKKRYRAANLLFRVQK